MLPASIAKTSLLVLIALLCACGETPRPHSSLADVKSFAFASTGTGIEALAASRYDALVLTDPTLVGKAIVDLLHQSKGESGRGKLVLGLADVREGDALLDRLVAAGFDGACLLGLGEAEGDARSRTIALVQRLAQRAQAKGGNFAILPIDVAELVTEPAFAEHVDGIVQRNLWYIAASKDGDIRQAPAFRAALLPALRGAVAAGLPVFTLDYADSPQDAEAVYRAARDERFVAYVTTGLQAGLTKTPPAGAGQ